MARERRRVADEGVERAAERRRSLLARGEDPVRPRSCRSSISSSRCTVRSAIRRTLSIRPRRSIAGIAQSSPIDSGATRWNASTKSSTFSRSIRPSVCEISVIASS